MLWKTQITPACKKMPPHPSTRKRTNGATHAVVGQTVGAGRGVGRTASSTAHPSPHCTPVAQASGKLFNGQKKQLSSPSLHAPGGQLSKQVSSVVMFSSGNTSPLNRLPNSNSSRSRVKRAISRGKSPKSALRRSESDSRAVNWPISVGIKPMRELRCKSVFFRLGDSFSQFRFGFWFGLLLEHLDCKRQGLFSLRNSRNSVNFPMRLGMEFVNLFVSRVNDVSRERSSRRS